MANNKEIKQKIQKDELHANDYFNNIKSSLNKVTQEKLRRNNYEHT